MFALKYHFNFTCNPQPVDQKFLLLCQLGNGKPFLHFF